MSQSVKLNGTKHLVHIIDVGYFSHYIMNIKIKHCSYHDTVTMVLYIVWLVIHQGFIWDTGWCLVEDLAQIKGMGGSQLINVKVGKMPANHASGIYREILGNTGK